MGIDGEWAAYFLQAEALVTFPSSRVVLGFKRNCVYVCGGVPGWLSQLGN